MFHLRSGLPILMVAALSCQGPAGPEGPAGPPGQPGTDGTNGTDSVGTDVHGVRLKRYINVFTASDGTKQVTAYYLYRDTKLNLDCSFVDTGDGQQRCLPAGADVLSSSTYDFSPAYFEDASCTQLVATAPKCGKGYKFATLNRYTAMGCSYVQNYVVAQNLVQITPTMLYSKSSVAGPGCNLMAKADLDNLLASYSLYALARSSQISLTEFVSGQSTQTLPGSP